MNLNRESISTVSDYLHKGDANTTSKLLSCYDLYEKKNDLIYLTLDLFTSGTSCNFIFEKNNGYSFIKDGYAYFFNLLSDMRIDYYEKEVLLDRETRKNESFFGNLRLMDEGIFQDKHLFFATTSREEFTSLIRYSDGNVNYIVDYDYNLVMQEQDYEKLFNLKVLKELTENDLDSIKSVYYNYKDRLPAQEVFEKIIKKSKGNN